MKKLLIIGMLAMTAVSTFTSCKKYLDINSDPDTPQFPDASSVFPTQLAGIPRGLQFDARYLGRYIQNWVSSTTATAANINFDRMGYTAASDNTGDIWRQVYYGLGKNLDYIINEGKTKGQWDYVGAAYALKAMMFQYATDYHGEVVFHDAFKENAIFFRYDEQEVVYKGVDSLCRLALDYLGRTDLNVNATKLAKGDYVYNGVVTKWIRFTNGLLARNFHRLTNKSTYNADSVIYYVDRALQTVDDDFLVPFDASKNDDTNFFGTYRNNLTEFRQTNFIVRLLDGTILAGTPPSAATAANRDPRLKHMLSASQDTTNGNGGFRGLDPGIGDPATGRTRVAVVWADSVYTNPSSAVFSTLYKKYLFGDKVVFPVMTAAELQFTKAEAAFLDGDKTTALAAYTNGIRLHFDFINRASFPRGNNALYNGSPISTLDRDKYLGGNNVKRTEASLTLGDIMLQKYIALWGWGFYETWVDLRRYHYVDLDPSNPTEQVYKKFTFPSQFAPENLGKPVYRVRPRYNSEYIWNRDELLRIGALNGDYHTYETWMSQP